MDEQNTVETTVETTATAAETTAVKEQATPTAKTFTQDELNAIIDKRLERERKDAQRGLTRPSPKRRNSPKCRQMNVQSMSVKSCKRNWQSVKRKSPSAS